MLVSINDISIGERIRKELGDIKDLAMDIEENGLINPPVVTSNFDLISGERRLEALKHLGYKDIEVRVMNVKDYEHMLNLEISENESRKDFTKLERLEYARRLEQIERLKAKERQSTLNNTNSLTENFPEGGETRDIVANRLGIGSGRQYEKEKYIAENADKETLDAWNNEDISTHKAYMRIKELEEKLREQEQISRSFEDSYYQAATTNSELTQKVKNLENRSPEIVEKIVEVEPRDYKDMKRALEDKELEIEKLRGTKNLLEKKAKLNEDEAKKYNDMKRQLDFLYKQKTDLSRQIESATELSGLAVKIDRMLKNDLAPIRYSRVFERMDSEIARENLLDILDGVSQWCFEVKNMIPKKYRREEVYYEHKFGEA